MINGVNTVDFTFATAESKNAISSELPKGRSELISVFQYAYQPDSTISAKSVSNTKDFTLIQTEPIDIERVHVQRLQTHAQLRNNRWNYQTFYSLNTATDSIMDTTYKTPNNNNNNNSNTNNKNIGNKSAFIKCNNKEEPNKYIPNTAGIRLEYIKSAAPTKIVEPKRSIISGDNGAKAPNMLSMGDKFISDTYTAKAVDGRMERSTVPNYYRTEDQENAFRRIEDVHNYAKLNRYGNSNESSDGSTREYDDEDDDDDDDEDDVDDDEEVGEVRGDGETRRDVDVEYRDVRKTVKLININKGTAANDHVRFLEKTQVPCKNVFTSSKSTESHSMSTEDTDAIVDIETVSGENEQQLMQSPPAHHARRPMNAFLIFCKRHRAIVKDRYKSLENRAITKILGDWWASLDADEKDCFTKLAQQNKDAFFSAHPNFKWYKLPAPPLRTLSTRPSNAERASEEHEYEAEEAKSPNKAQSGSYFKLADETQMGELNTLINARSKQEGTTQCPLQKALGETTHFLSAHMPSAGDIEFTDALNEKCSVKRRAITENSFSSNSSEDDVLPRKTSRSCKGKIYQELVSSGQIAPITKKAKTTKVPSTMQFSNDFNDASENHPNMMASPETAYFNRVMDIRGSKSKRTVSESDVSHHFGDQFGQFDLEDKIRKLPALSLDAYLQRKRNTKKKKKFTTRKRNSNSVSLPITEPRAVVSITPPKEIRHQCPVAVGSQKRKARKESITRRDISAIENEITSLIPLTSEFDSNNGRYYFNDMSTLTTNTATSPSFAVKSTEMANISELPTHVAANDSSRAYSNYVDNITTTSDLFILAEVAAKRTELTN